MEGRREHRDAASSRVTGTMEYRPHTSSDHSQDGSGWSFMRLNSAQATNNEVQQPQSRSPSSYLRGSDMSSISPLTNHHRAYDASRSSRSLSRNLPSASTGARSTTTLPSQPVLSRINSELAYDHNNQFVRRNRRSIARDPITGMPALKEFTMAGILAAIEEDIEGHVSTIAEILGRNRFVLADEYGAQLPPQGEIMGEDGNVEEAETHHEIDNVMVADLDASVIDGSNAGSAAYGLLERLQVLPPPVRMTSDAPLTLRAARDHPAPTARTISSPAAVGTNLSHPRPATAQGRARAPSTSQAIALYFRGRGPSRPVVAETWLSPEADGVNSGMVPRLVEAGREHPLYTHEELDLFQGPAPEIDSQISRTENIAWSLSTLPIIASWFPRAQPTEPQDAEARLRGLLNR